MKFLTDEHIPPALVRGLKRSLPEIDILELRHTHLLGESDPVVLAFAAEEDRIFISRDISTIPDFAYERILKSKKMPGVFIWRRKAALGKVLEDLILLVEVSHIGEWSNQVIYLPID